jgi:urea-proton symporter
MNYLILSGTLLLTLTLIISLYYRQQWGGSITNLLFANRSLSIVSAGLAINSHWFWAVAIFISPTIAYNWGIIGLLWFVIPNALSLLVVAWLTHRVRDRYPDGFSLTEYIRLRTGKTLSVCYQIIYVLIALYGMLLGFTALFKYFNFVKFDIGVEPIYIVLIFGLITLLFTITGGIRSSILSGSIQTVAWLSFLAIAMFYVWPNSSVSVFDISGKNQLTTVFDYAFLTTFAVIYIITISVSATSHGMMWQKSFSMPKENILPSYAIATVLFAIMVFMVGSLGLYAQGSGLSVSSADTSQLSTISTLVGPIGLLIFGILIIGQTSTVMDACMNYVSSVASIEWFKSNNILLARSVMVVFFFLAWLLTWLKLDIWTIFMLVGILRVTMFFPLVSIVCQRELNYRFAAAVSVVAILGAFYLSYLAKLDKMPIYDMYSALFALGMSAIAVGYSGKKSH